jgi:hypothetical protein
MKTSKLTLALLRKARTKCLVMGYRSDELAFFMNRHYAKVLLWILQQNFRHIPDNFKDMTLWDIPIIVRKMPPKTIICGDKRLKW